MGKQIREIELQLARQQKRKDDLDKDKQAGGAAPGAGVVSQSEYAKVPSRRAPPALLLGHIYIYQPDGGARGGGVLGGQVVDEVSRLNSVVSELSKQLSFMQQRVAELNSAEGDSEDDDDAEGGERGMDIDMVTKDGAVKGVAGAPRGRSPRKGEGVPEPRNSKT